MSRLSRAARRIVVIGAVMALAAVLIAPSAGSSENGNSNLDPPGVDVPGWEAEKVSGEATGCHSEIEADITLEAPIIDSISAADASAVSSALDPVLAQIPPGAGFLTDLINGLQSQVNAGASEVSASQVLFEATFHEEAGPVPEVEIPWQGGGPVVEEEDDCTLSLFGFIHIPLARDLRVESEGLIGPAGYAHSESESHDNLGLIYFDNEKIDTECLATLEDIDAKTDIDGGRFVDLVNLGGGQVDAIVKDLPEDPDENEELVDFEFQSGSLQDLPLIDIGLSLTANEQEETDKSVTVTGLHSELEVHLVLNGPLEGRDLLTIDLTAEGIRDESHCDIHPVQVATPPAEAAAAAVVVVEPKFTG
jgi:hypothetical protein